MGKGRVDNGQLISATTVTCDHAKQRLYVQRYFDILNGFEVVVTRCCNCHKTLALEGKRLG
jgi:hypothetical protein